MKFKTLRSIVLLCTMFTLVLSLAACGPGSSTTPSTTPAEATQAASTAEATQAASTAEATKDLGNFEFSLSLHDPATSNNGKFMQAWADEIAQKTDGHVKITLYPSGSLATAADVGEMVETGGVDIGWLFTSFYKGQFPLTDVTTIPLAGFTNPVVSTKALWDLYEKYEQVRNEWKNYKVLNLYTNPGNMFATSSKEIKSPADLKGLSLRSPAGPITTFVTTLGASPIVMSPADLYEALQKNNVQGFVFEEAGITNFKLQEVTKYIYDMPMYTGTFGIVMNLDKWNSLPPEYQKVLEETTQKAGSIVAAEKFDEAAKAARKVITDAGAQFITPTEEAKAEFQKIADGVAAAWPDTIKVEGIDAKAYLEDAKAMAAKYK